MIKLKNILLENNHPLIVYHGTGNKFRKFNTKKSTQGIIWFTSNKEKILKHEVGASDKGYLITAELTMENPAGWDEYEKYLLIQLKQLGYDGAVLKDGNDSFDCFVFNPDKIKIINVEKV